MIFGLNLEALKNGGAGMERRGLRGKVLGQFKEVELSIRLIGGGGKALNLEEGALAIEHMGLYAFLSV